MLHDIAHNTGVVHLLDAQSINADTYSDLLDLQGFEGALIVVNIGTFTPNSAEMDVYLQHCDTTAAASFVAVPTADMIDISGVATGDAGEIAALTTTNHDNKTLVVGYKGTKRYLRIFFDEVGSITSILVSVDGIVAYGRRKPITAPTAVAAT